MSNTLKESRILHIEAAHGVTLDAALKLPQTVKGVVLFPYAGSFGRHTAQNMTVVDALNRAGLATIEIDLTTGEEDRSSLSLADAPDRLGVFAARLAALGDWVRGYPALAGQRLYGVATGAETAVFFEAVTQSGLPLRSLVACDARMEMAAQRFPNLDLPVLLLVAEKNAALVAHNRASLAKLPIESRMKTIPQVSHIAEDGYAMTIAGHLIGRWFCRDWAVAEQWSKSSYALQSQHALVPTQGRATAV